MNASPLDNLALAQTRALEIDKQILALQGQADSIEGQKELYRSQIRDLTSARYNQAEVSVRSRTTTLFNAPDPYTTTTGQVVTQASYRPGPGWPMFTTTIAPGTNNTNPSINFGFTWTMREQDPTLGQQAQIEGQLYQLDGQRGTIQVAIAARTEQVKFQTLDLWQNWELARTKLALLSSQQAEGKSRIKLLRILYRHNTANLGQLQNVEDRSRSDQLALVEATAAVTTAAARLRLFLQLPL